MEIAYTCDLVVPGSWDERFDDRPQLFNLADEALTAR
jgi:hypothetical protein